MKIANSSCRPFVQEHKPFTGSNLFACNQSNTTEQWYVVYSYGEHFPLFIHANGCWFENEDGFSQSTSRHRSQTHPRTNTILLSTHWMRVLANGGWAAIAKERILSSAPTPKQSNTEVLMAFMGG